MFLEPTIKTMTYFALILSGDSIWNAESHFQDGRHVSPNEICKDIVEMVEWHFSFCFKSVVNGFVLFFNYGHLTSKDISKKSGA